MAIDVGTVKRDKGSAWSGWREQFAARSARVSVKERLVFTERLSLLLETGTSLQTSLHSLRQQTAAPRLSAIIGALEEDILAGNPFSQALAGHPEMFPQTYVNLVRSSEKGGFMGAVLRQLMLLDEKRERLAGTLRAAMTYPAFLTLFSALVVVFILTVVFPKFGEMFASIYDHLPLTTRALMQVSNLLVGYWYLVLLAAAAAIGGGLAWFRSPAGRDRVDRLKLQIPWVRELFVEVYLVQVLRILALSLNHGVPIVDALASCREVVSNKVFRAVVATAEEGVLEGRGLAVGFEASPLIPALARQLIRTGEESGEPAMVMERLADFYESELNRRVVMFTKIVEPALLLVMGVMVGVLVSSLILPIFKLSRAVQ